MTKQDGNSRRKTWGLRKRLGLYRISGIRKVFLCSVSRPSVVSLRRNIISRCFPSQISLCIGHALLDYQRWRSLRILGVANQDDSDIAEPYLENRPRAYTLRSQQRRNNTARIRCSPNLKLFSVVRRVVSIGSFRSFNVMARF